MNAPTLSQQIEACELAAHRVRQKKPLAMRDAEREEHARRLAAAAETLRRLTAPAQATAAEFRAAAD